MQSRIFASETAAMVDLTLNNTALYLVVDFFPKIDHSGNVSRIVLGFIFLFVNI